jgi:hypothetical protein
MTVAGKVYVAPLASEKKWQLLIENTGNEVFGITQNILPPDAPDRTQHDDHGRYGHGLPVNPGEVSYQKFEQGDMYLDQYPITEECFLRVGIRGHAAMTVKLPKMTDPPLVIDVADFNWYAGNPNAHNNQIREWTGSKEYKPNASDGKATLAMIRDLIERANRRGVECHGKARIVPVRGEGAALSHWELWFENAGDQAWIGTCAFTRAQKNDGIGLESMALPNNGSAAMQRIEAFGNYGIEAVPGETLRLGVRGYSWIEVPLPADEAIEIPLDQFKIDTRKFAPEFFDREAILEKRNEKIAKVQFFDQGQPINDRLEPKVWRGADARARATFDPPSLEVTAVEDGPETPGGGWRVTLTSKLPEFDDAGRVGFVAAIKLAGADPANPAAKTLPPKKLCYPGHEKSWFVPRGTDLGGAQAEVGTELLIATRGLGWSASVALPEPGRTIDSRQDDQIWGLREDQYNRRSLRPEFVQRVRT